MARFKRGDRVEIIGDIGNYYESPVGIVIAENSRDAAVLKEFRVKLSNGIPADFFDFQLRVPPSIVAPLIFDSGSAGSVGTRGGNSGRNLRWLTKDFDIHLRLKDSPKGTALQGQLNPSSAPHQKTSALACLLNGDRLHKTCAAAENGQFEFAEVPAGNVEVEILVPGQRVVLRFAARSAD